MFKLRNILVALAALIAGFVFAFIIGLIVGNPAVPVGEGDSIASYPGQLEDEPLVPLTATGATNAFGNMTATIAISSQTHPETLTPIPLETIGETTAVAGVPTQTPSATLPLTEEAIITITPTQTAVFSSTNEPSLTPALSFTPTMTNTPVAPIDATLTPIGNQLQLTNTPQPGNEIPATRTVITSTRVIGYSSANEEFGIGPLPITVYQFNDGPNKLLFVGGVHGGYEWNTIRLAYNMIKHFEENPQEIPDSITLYIIPSANPFGQYLVTGKAGDFYSEDVAADTFRGRFNANNVDINRNFDCQWSEEAYWRDQRINAGSSAFSEPESDALRNFILESRPLAAVFWHSVANGIFGASCDGVLYEASMDLARVYSEGAKYPVYEAFTAYPITGDATDWLVKESIPAITVELASSGSTESGRNLAGMLELFEYYKNWSSAPIIESE